MEAHLQALLRRALPSRSALDGTNAAERTGAYRRVAHSLDAAVCCTILNIRHCSSECSLR